MPELPEVETVARQLAPLLTGRTIVSIKVSDPLLRTSKGLALTTRNVGGRCIKSVYRSGKQVVLELAADGKESRWLVFHLRMTGRLLFHEDGAAAPADRRRLDLALDKGRLGFYDTRRFGTAYILESEGQFAPAGVDPVAGKLTTAALMGLMEGSPQEIKAWLLRQDKLVGLGNIYACEILYRAGVNPWAPAGSLSKDEAAAIVRATKSILGSAIRNCGTTFSDFQDSQGHIGGYQKYLKVYGRRGEGCRKCGAVIERVVQQQRSTFFCPSCQR